MDAILTFFLLVNIDYSREYETFCYLGTYLTYQGGSFDMTTVKKNQYRGWAPHQVHFALLLSRYIAIPKIGTHFLFILCLLSKDEYSIPCIRTSS